MTITLFNIVTLLSNKGADVRFPFDRYKQENWDIEHIRSQTNKEITGQSHKEEWLKDVLEYFTGSKDYGAVDIDRKLGEEVDEFVFEICSFLRNDKIDESSFSTFYKKIASFFKEEDEVDVDGLGNLALLDAKTNSSYKNAMFPIKRKCIIDNDKQGLNSTSKCNS